MKRLGRLSIDSLVLFLIVSCCFAFLIFSQILPFDFFLSHSKFQKESDYIYTRNLSRMMICSKAFYNPDFKEYYDNPEALFANSAHHFYSPYKNKRIAVVSIQGSFFVAHKFINNSFWSYIMQITAKASPAFRAWYYGHLLAKLGIHVAKPLLVIEKRFGPFCVSSYLVTSYLSGISAFEYFKEDSPFKEHWAETSDNLINTLTTLNQAKIVYLNLRLHNFVIKNNQPYLIDLDRLHKFHFSHTKYQQKHLKQYCISLEKDLKNAHSDASTLFTNKRVLLSH